MAKHQQSEGTSSVAADLVDFLNASPTAFHAVDEAEKRLTSAGYEQVSEREDWSLEAGKTYFFTTNHSTIVAFAIGKKYVAGNGFHVIGAHTDSPCLKLKPVSKVSKGGYLEVGVQTYGGGLWHTWFDRDLTVAGRMIIREGKDGNVSYSHRLVRIAEPIMRIPTLAIHLDRDVNDGFKVNTQSHLVPVLATSIKAELNKVVFKNSPAESGSSTDGNRSNEKSKTDNQKHHSLLLQLLAAEVGCEICDFELQACDTQPSIIAGATKEFVFSGRLDNLCMSFWGPKPFRFLNAWTLHPNFKIFVQKIWAESHINGWAGFKCVRKLRLLKSALKSWNLEVFGKVDFKLKQLEEEIHDLDLVTEQRSLTEAERSRLREVKGEVWNLSKMVEWLWLQKSRANWSLKGDRNTKFFHVMASTRRNRNALCSIEVNGALKEDSEEIRFEVLNHFQRQFEESWFDRPCLSGPFKSIGDEEVRVALEAEFSESEVVAAINNCDGNKAPGPDGFNVMMFQKCWQIIKGDVMQFMREFHTNSKLVLGINSSFVALLPKNENPSSLNDFRPISLIGSLYKVLSKVLSTRLKVVLPKIISEAQFAFMEGRSILDGILIANEIVDGWKKKHKKGIILKLDFEKAYDSINWGFLFSMLSNFGFGSKWIKWMKECVSTAKVSILVNGSPTAEFSPQRGLRQGDPLSPFLFNIVAEGLNILFHRAVQAGLLKGASVGSNGLIITHLQFADDTILFCEAKREEVLNIKRILRCFEILSGLKINYHKSVVCGIGINEELTKDFAAILNCLHHRLPLKYLGMPLGANPRRKRTWQPVIDKYKLKLASWK